MYRAALAHRARLFTADEELEWLELGDDVLAFRRGSGVICVVNFGAEPVALPAGEVLVASLPGDHPTLPHDAAVWLRPT